VSIQAAATVVALGVAFVLMAAVPAVLIWVFLATLGGEGIVEPDGPAAEREPAPPQSR
jgi:hypothetical protein